ncbi:MAG: RNA-binding protein [Patescibacteria group bacterium]|nr:RNA-binding protein [Patescibacteria group bacterium]
MKKLFIGGLSFETNEYMLTELFAKAGTVTSAVVIKDKMTKRSKGFGFVEMETEEMAQAAIAMWNGQELDGRKVTVNEARPLEKRF